MKPSYNGVEDKKLVFVQTQPDEQTNLLAEPNLGRTERQPNRIPGG